MIYWKNKFIIKYISHIAVKRYVLKQWIEEFQINDKFILEFIRYMNQDPSREQFCNQLNETLNNIQDLQQKKNVFYSSVEKKVQEMSRQLDAEFEDKCLITQDIWKEMLANEPHQEVQVAKRLCTNPQTGQVNSIELNNYYNMYNYMKKENWNAWKNKLKSYGPYFSFLMLRKVLETTPKNSHSSGIVPIGDYINSIYETYKDSKETADYINQYRSLALKNIVDENNPELNGNGWVVFSNRGNMAEQMTMIGSKMRVCLNAARISKDYLDHNNIHIFFENYNPSVILIVNRNGGYATEIKGQDNNIPHIKYFSRIIDYCKNNGIKFVPEKFFHMPPFYQNGTIDFLPLISKFKNQRPEEFNELPNDIKQKYQEQLNDIIISIRRNPKSYFSLYLEVQKMPEIQALQEVQQLINNLHSTEINRSFQYASNRHF